MEGKARNKFILGIDVGSVSVSLVWIDGGGKLLGQNYQLHHGDIRDTLEHALDLIIDGGNCGFEPTTVVELTEDAPVVVRVGLGPVDMLDQS